MPLGQTILNLDNLNLRFHIGILTFFQQFLHFRTIRLVYIFGKIVHKSKIEKKYSSVATENYIFPIGFKTPSFEGCPACRFQLRVGRGLRLSGFGIRTGLLENKEVDGVDEVKGFFSEFFIIGCLGFLTESINVAINYLLQFMMLFRIC